MTYEKVNEINGLQPVCPAGYFPNKINDLRMSALRHNVSF